jgi:hypothetical protein
VADAHTDDYHHGEMNVSAQAQDFHTFLTVTKWACLHIAALVLLLTLWFCTDAGFLTAFISAAILVAIGVAVLRDKPGSAH